MTARDELTVTDGTVTDATIVIHHEHDQAHPTCQPGDACWWAESEDLPGWTGAADTAAELGRLIGEVLALPAWSRDAVTWATWATWVCPHLSGSGPIVAMRCGVCGPMQATQVTYRVAS